MIVFNDGVMIPRLIYPVFDGFFIGLSCLNEIYLECSVFFLSRDDEKIGVFYLDVFIVEFTAVDLKIDVHDVVIYIR